MSTLIIKNDGLGDLVLASGLITSLAQTFGEPIDLLTCVMNREIAQAIEGVENYIYVSRDMRFADHETINPSTHFVPREMIDREALKVLSSKKYDRAICLRRYIRQSSLIAMQRAHAVEKQCCWQFPTNIDRDLANAFTKGWTHHALGHQPLHELTYFQKFLETILDKEIDPAPRLVGVKRTSESQPNRVGLILGGASCRWDTSRWLEMLSPMYERGIRFSLFGGPDAMEAGLRIQSVMHESANLIGKVGFFDAIPELSRCMCVVGHDTGMTHFASLVVPRVVVILGGGTFGRFLPWPESVANHQHVVYESMDCFDCLWRCKHESPKCMEHSPESIRNVVEQAILGQAPRIKDLAGQPTRYQLQWRLHQDGDDAVFSTTNSKL